MINAVITWIQARMVREDGQDLIEYALFGGIIAAGILGAALLFSGAIDGLITGVGDCIDFDGATACSP